MAAKDDSNKIRNVGPKSAAWLRQVGVRTQEDLQRLGPVEAFMKVKRAGFRPSLNLLYALAGAIENCHWADLPERAQGRAACWPPNRPNRPTRSRRAGRNRSSAASAAAGRRNKHRTKARHAESASAESDFLDDPDAARKAGTKTEESPQRTTA